MTTLDTKLAVLDRQMRAYLALKAADVIPIDRELRERKAFQHALREANYEIARAMRIIGEQV